jgi:hypothetical protein
MTWRRGLICTALVASFALSIVARAQETGPSAHRIYMLCMMEDPTCGPLFVALARDVIDNPVHRGQRYRCPAFNGGTVSVRPATRLPSRPPIEYVSRFNDSVYLGQC